MYVNTCCGNKKLQQQRVFASKKEFFFKSFARKTEAFITSVQPPLPLRKKNLRRGPSPNFSELRGQLNTGQNLH